MRHKIQKIHFVGVGGAGMCGLASVMHGLGYEVSGSDSSEQASLQALRAEGVKVYVGHSASYGADADCVVYSGAVPPGNPERRAAAKRGAPVIPRAQMLGEVLRFKSGIAVAGTHGKTTVSSMLAAILDKAGMDPTCIIGGKFGYGGKNSRIGKGDFVVAEADESDASFLHLQPAAALVTNIDDDHLAAFGGEFENLWEAFRSFLENLPFYGAAVICADCRASARLARAMSSVRVVTYGFHAKASVRATDVRARGGGMRFRLSMPGMRAREFSLRTAGAHNVQNAAGACAMASELGAPPEAMQSALAEFRGAGRRLEPHGEISAAGGKAMLMDDYAHHPTEIAAAIDAMRGAHPRRRIVGVFQPHRHTRTRDLFGPLCDSLALADFLILLPVYSAGEKPVRGSGSAALAREIEIRGGAGRGRGKVRRDAAARQADSKTVLLAKGLTDAVRLTRAHARASDVILVMGAGDVGSLPSMLKEAA